MQSLNDEDGAPREGGEEAGNEVAEERREALTAYCLDLLDQLFEVRAENRALAGGPHSSESLRLQLVRERAKLEVYMARAENFAEQLEAMKAADQEREAARREFAAATKVLAATVGLPEESSIGQVAERVAGLVLTLADHKRWVASLLSEVAGRRLKVRPRRLQEHERRFLEEQGLGQE